MTTVVLTGIEKSYGPTPVLRGIDLVVADGSLTAVLGRSGSGKTTLLRVLAGFERPDAGRVEIGGEVIVDQHHMVAAERRRIGYVPQEGALFPHLDVAANIAFGLPRGPARQERVKEVLELIGLSGYEHRRPHELSGGQQQRVALGRALAPMPHLLLLDEPFSSLDAKMRSELRADVVAVLRATATTAILVTHDQDEALSLADSVAVLRHGRIGQVGSPREVYESPRTPAIAAFVGVANLVEGVRHGGVVATPLGELALRNLDAEVEEGETVIALIRPEELEIDFSSATDGLAVEVDHVEYYGHDALVRLRVLDSGPKTVRAVFRGGGDGGAHRVDAFATVIVRAYRAGVISVGARATLQCHASVIAWHKRPHPSMRRHPDAPDGERAAIAG